MTATRGGGRGGRRGGFTGNEEGKVFFLFVCFYYLLSFPIEFCGLCFWFIILYHLMLIIRIAFRDRNAGAQNNRRKPTDEVHIAARGRGGRVRDDRRSRTGQMYGYSFYLKRLTCATANDYPATLPSRSNRAGVPPLVKLS